MHHGRSLTQLHKALRGTPGRGHLRSQALETASAACQVPAAAEAVKPGETSFGYLVCMRASGVGWLIQATVGSFGGVGGRANRAGWAA
jgi:hypothetical protein